MTHEKCTPYFAMPITHHSSPAEKIALFRWLFRGRGEVYPLRFESVKTGGLTMTLEIIKKSSFEMSRPWLGLLL
jgi:hypothetical protein